MDLDSEFRDYHRAHIEQARQKRSGLGAKSHVGSGLTDDMLRELEGRVETASEPDLTYDRWPCVFSFVVRHSEEALAELDADIDLVLSRTAGSRKDSVGAFLRTSQRRTGAWFGGLFEVWSKATFLKKAEEVQLDVGVPSGRDHDISAIIGSHRVHFECSVLTQDDEARDVWDRFLEHKKLNLDQVLVRPGPFCPPNSKGPSLYYETLRLYAKVYDKLAKNLDPAKSQFVVNQPNVLLICFAGPGVGSDRPGVGWGLEELFSCHPKIARTGVPESFTDISLETWADFTAKQLIAQEKMTVEWYCENSHCVLEGPRHLGGALLFDDSKLAGARINYNAFERCRVSHADMAALERLLAEPAKYFTH
jgi:hypothetical protein